MASIRNDLTNVRSSLAFEIFSRINFGCLVVWTLVESISFIYKNETIIYPSQGQVAGEIILMICVFFFDSLRLVLGSIANRTENILLAVFTIVLTVAILFGYLYFIVWQLFVIRAELIMSVIGLACSGISIAFLILSIAFFARPAATPSIYRQIPYRTAM